MNSLLISPYYFWQSIFWFPFYNGIHWLPHSRILSIYLMLYPLCC